MSGGLQGIGDDAPPRCAFCVREAVGPCAGCRRMVCAECCTLTEGGAKTWAVCLECDRKKGRRIGGMWRGFGAWMVGLLVLMAIVLALLERLWPNQN